MSLDKHIYKLPQSQKLNKLSIIYHRQTTQTQEPLQNPYQSRMKEQAVQLTDISKILLEKLSYHPTAQSLKNKHFLDELNVLFLTKKPVTHTFVCDSSTSVQVELKSDKSKPIEEYDLNPWNKVMTHYYQVTHDHDKYVYTLNCADKTLFDRYGIKGSDQDQNPSQNGMFGMEESSSLEALDRDYQPNAYEPLHYFPRNIFDYFLKNRQNLTLPDPLEMIRITDWVLKVVNISGSVWYSFVIEVHKFKFLNEKFNVHEPLSSKSTKSNSIVLKNVGSIIYDRRFQSILEKMRLNHIRQDMENFPIEQEQQLSMCYHLRNVRASHKLPKMSQFVTLDSKGEVIKFNTKKSVNFIPIGELEGMCSFPQPVNLNDPQKKQQMKQQSAFSMKGLQQILNKQVVNIRKEKQMRQRLEYRSGKDRKREPQWDMILKPRIENSLFRVQQNGKGNLQSTYSGSDSEESELWSDSGTNQQKSKEVQNEMEDENYVTNYSDLINNEMINNDSESSEEEENEYFRKYREEMKKTFQISNPKNDE